MKALQNRTLNLQGQSVVADVAARVAAIFAQYPMLCGFSVQERSTVTRERAVVQLEGELWLSDVSVLIPPGLRVTQEFGNRIAGTLLELIDEEPLVRELLAGRTFAREFH
jgi:hypothetical protein